MDDWMLRYSRALGFDEGLEIDSTTLLALARDVAHATERKNAPLASFIVGQYIARRQAEGVSARDAMTEALVAAERLLGKH